MAFLNWLGSMILHWAMTPEGTLVILGWLGMVGYGVKMLLARAVAKRGARTARAFEFIERGVREVYGAYVESIKAASADGTLSLPEREEAKTRAIAAASDLAFKDGIDLVKEVGTDALPGMVEAAVGRAKDRLPLSRIEAEIRSALGRVR